jgi:hypothetical protein
MKRIVTATIAAATLLTAAMAVAADQVAAPQPQSQVYYYQQPVGTPQYYSQAQPQQEQRQGFFGRMMELERRKNQALLRFFGLR